MDGKEQEALFEKVKERHPKWAFSRCSGYVHGIVDEGKVSEPLDCYLGNYDAYSKGYVGGFIDARGEDAFLTDWFQTHYGEIGYNIDFQWWTK